MLIAHAYKNPSHISHHFATDKGHTFCIHFHTLCVSVCIDMPLYPTLTCKPIGPSKCYEHFISHEKFIRFVLGANMPCLHRLFDMLFLKPREMKSFDSCMPHFVALKISHSATQESCDQKVGI